ncbi:MAG: DUF3078 domain-containing protein [Bacteroidaceae bacterium]|nr:DUF3078 domain-containing protein [Bacteroidaceae bacterium]
MKLRHTLLFAFFLWMSTSMMSQNKAGVVQNDIAPVDTSALLKKYSRALDSLAVLRDSLDALNVTPAPDAYFYRLMVPGTFYTSSIHQFFALEDTAHISERTKLYRAVNHSLARLYTANPWLVSQTEGQIKGQGTIREDITTTAIQTSNNLSEKVIEPNLSADVDEMVTVITRRPNFFRFSGSASMQFTQNYATDHWFQGVDNHISGTSVLSLNLNYDNKKKITWTNNLDARLGFRTNKNDKRRVFQPNTNAVTYTTNVGYSIVKTLRYTMQVRMSTSIVPAYAANSMNVITDVLSPLDVTVGPGIGYSFNWGKKKRYSGAVNLSPLAYQLRYVQRESLVQRYSVRPGHHSYHKFGPTATLQTTWRICNQVTWTSKIFWASNLHYTNIQWENTFAFSVNKYMSANLYVFPKFDDSNRNYKNDHGNYLMMRESLSISMNYSF